MRSVRHWSRRSVLAALTAVAGAMTARVAVTAGGIGQGTGAESFPELLRRAVLDLDMPCNAAEAFLSAASDEERARDVGGLVASVRDRLAVHERPSSDPAGGSGSLPDTEGLIRQLARAIRDDFAEGALCLVDGWQLSMTECRLAALKLLWERERGGQTAGHPVGPAACRQEPLLASGPTPTISSVEPRRTSVGVPFTVQPNGKSVINVYGAEFQPGAEILFDGEPLDSAVGHAGWINAYVPAEIYSRERTVDVAVRNPDGKVSNVMRFEVVARDD